MKRFVYLLAVLVAAAFAAGPTMPQTNPFVGTWTLNVAKSKYEGTAAPKSLTRTVTAEGSGLKYSFEGEAADGSKLSHGFSSNLDGKDSPVTGTGISFWKKRGWKGSEERERVRKAVRKREIEGKLTAGSAI
jgi:hypothetical protein